MIGCTVLLVAVLIIGCAALTYLRNEFDNVITPKL